MKRDMDLIRTILQRLEDSDNPEPLERIEVEGKSAQEVSYHVLLAVEAGLITGLDASDSAGIDWIPGRLTWEDHEFLEASRNDALWNKAKEVTLSKSGGMALEVVKGVLLELAKRAAIGALG